MITQSRLKELLHYDPNTGVFAWRVSRGTQKAGNTAGRCFTTKSGKSYSLIQIDSKLYYTHRLAWLYTHGQFPFYEIDHINGDGTDNRLPNLRSVTRSENQKNRRLQSNNSSGICGVYWQKSKHKWLAKIKVDSKELYLGCFTDIDDAIAARKAAEIEHGFHENHGESRSL